MRKLSNNKGSKYLCYVFIQVKYFSAQRIEKEVKQYLEDLSHDEDKKKSLITGKRVDLAEELSMFISYMCIFSRIYTKITGARNDVARSYHKMRGLYFLAVIFTMTIML